MSLKMFNGDDLPHELLLTRRQKTKLRNSFNNNVSTDLKLSKTQIFKIIQSGVFLGRLLGPLLKTGLPLMKNVIKPLAKSVLIPLELIAVASAADAGIYIKILASVRRHSSSSASHNTTLIISYDEMKNIIKIVKWLEDSGLLLKGVSETVQYEAREQKGGFLSMLLDMLGASLLGNILASRGINREGAIAKRQGWGVIRAGEGVIRAGYGNKRQDYKNKVNF